MIDRFVDALNNAGLPEVTLGALLAFLFTVYIDGFIEEFKHFFNERTDSDENY